MDIGIGLPSTIPGVDRDSLLTWAQRAEELGFSSLGTIDRLVYPNYEPLVALGAAAAVTERIRLMTDVLLVPWRNNPVLLAKQAATLDSISGGRLSLGVGLGARADDYEASGVPMGTRGRALDEALEIFKQVWSGEPVRGTGPVGPPAVRDGGPELIVGGRVDASVRRVAKYGDGWTMGGGTPDDFARMAEKVRAAWSEAGREGEPRLIALCYFALGDGAREAADWYLHDYYAFLGDIADAIAQSAVVDADMARQYGEGFAAAGADELIYFPCSTDVGQVDLLAEAVLHAGAVKR
jgi:alkanesulfonate monooxygenase SsuD/methylene tetrahydromethanopterin reductase-like flavin-dependent oxidoreductase (luciferase family)